MAERVVARPEAALDKPKTVEGDSPFYRCENPACTLGDRHNPGYFAGGLSEQGYFVMTGDPHGEEGKNFGEGFCPICGDKAKTDRVDRTPAKGEDPYQGLHEKVEAMVLDDSNKDVTRENAMEHLYELINKKHKEEVAPSETADA